MTNIPDHLKTNLLDHLQEIIGPRDPYLSPLKHLTTKQYITKQLQNYGSVETNTFVFNGQAHDNIILNLPAINSQRKELIIIGAHYDSVPGSPGADDNASGVAVLLEISRFLANLTQRKYPIQMIAFDLEEYGLIGSQHYAHQLHQQKVKIRLMISLEMIGYCNQAPNSQQYPLDLLRNIYPDQGNFIALIGNLKTIPDLVNLTRKIRKTGLNSQFLPMINRGNILPPIRLSDHAPFWDHDYPAIMVTDTSYFRNPHYHKLTDQLDTLDLEFMTLVCQGLMIGLKSML